MSFLGINWGSVGHKIENTLGTVADAIIPGDQSSWHQSSAPAPTPQPTYNAPVQQPSFNAAPLINSINQMAGVNAPAPQGMIRIAPPPQANIQQPNPNNIGANLRRFATMTPFGGATQFYTSPTGQAITKGVGSSLIPLAGSIATGGDSNVGAPSEAEMAAQYQAQQAGTPNQGPLPNTHELSVPEMAKNTAINRVLFGSGAAARTAQTAYGLYNGGQTVLNTRQALQQISQEQDPEKRTELLTNYLMGLGMFAGGAAEGVHGVHQVVTNPLTHEVFNSAVDGVNNLLPQPLQNQNGYVRLDGQTPQEAKSQLFTVRGAQPENFARELQQGGQVAPSIAVTPNPERHLGFFGNSLRLFYGPDTINPQTHPDNYLYNGDAWTPIHPDTVSTFTGQADPQFHTLLGGAAKDGINTNAVQSELLSGADPQGVANDLRHMYGQDELANYIEKHSESMLWDPNQQEHVPYTPENALQIIKDRVNQVGDVKGAAYGAPMYAIARKQIKSLDQALSTARNVRTEETATSRAIQISHQTRDAFHSALGPGSDILLESMVKTGQISPKVIGDAYEALHGTKMDPRDANTLARAVRQMVNAPTDYLEAKPIRVVPTSEVKAALVHPAHHDQVANAIAASGHNIPLYTYEDNLRPGAKTNPAIEGSRKAIKVMAQEHPEIVVSKKSLSQRLLDTWNKQGGYIKLPGGKEEATADTVHILNERQQAQKNATEEDRTLGHRANRNLRMKFTNDVPAVTDFTRKVAKLWKDSTGKNLPPSKDLDLKVDEQRRSSSLGDLIMHHYGLEDAIHTAVNSGLNLDHLGQYLVDKHLLSLSEQGRVVAPRDLEEAHQVVSDLGPQYDGVAQKVTQFTHNMLDLMAENGLITKEAADYLKETNPDYVPLQRLFSPEEIETMRHQGQGAAATLTKQTVVRKLEGSAREIQNPLESLVNMSYSLANQIVKNEGANVIYEMAKRFGKKAGLKVLRNSENVRDRNAIHEEAGVLRQQREGIKKEITQNNRQAKKLATELNQLEKQGLVVRLRQDSNEAAKPGEAFRYVVKDSIIGRERTKTPGVAPEKVLSAATEVTGKHETRLSITRGMTDKEVETMLNAWMHSDPSELVKIRKMQSFRQAKLDTITGHLNDLKTELDNVKSNLNDKYSEAKLLRDANQKGKSIITGWDKQGTKFVVEVPHELRADLDNVHPKEPGDLLKGLSVGARIARAGQTVFSLPFQVVNEVRDPMSAFVLSEHGLRHLDPRTFIGAAYHMATKSDFYKGLLLRTLQDAGRVDAKKTVTEIASHANPGARAKYLVRHPEKALRAGEDLISAPERFTRTWTAMAELYGKKAKGLEGEDLAAATRKAAWYNTVNFGRSGTVLRDWNRLDQFTNAGVRGGVQMVEATRRRPVATLAKVGLMVGVIPAGIAAWNNLPQNQETYKEIPEYEKQSGLVVVTPWAARDPKTGHITGIVKIPMPQEYGRLAHLTTKSMEAGFHTGKIDAQTAFQDITQSLTGLNVDNWYSTIGSVIPTSIKPEVEAVANRNFLTGQKIVPDYMQDNPVDQQAFKSTSATAREIGKALGVSPLEVENFVRTALGTVGSEALAASDQIQNHLGANIPQEQVASGNPISDIGKRFYGTNGTSDAGLYAQAVQAGRNTLQTGDDKRWFDAYFSKQIDPSTGNTIQLEPKDRLTNASVLYNKPAILQAITTAQRSLADHSPLWDHSQTELQHYFDYEKAPSADPNKADIARRFPEVLTMWKENQDYFNQQVSKGKAEPSQFDQEHPYPTVSPQDQQMLDAMDSMSSQDKSKLLQANPQLVDVMNQLHNYSNAERANEGFSELRDSAQASPQIEKLIQTYNALPQHDGPKGGSKTRSLWIQSHPAEWQAITNYYTNADVYSVIKNVAKAQYKGTNLNSQALKGIANLGNYDVVKNADGTYSLSSGGGGGSSEGSSGGSYRVRSGSGGGGGYYSRRYSDRRGNNGYYEQYQVPDSMNGVPLPSAGKIHVKKFTGARPKPTKIHIMVPKRATRLDRLTG